MAYVVKIEHGSPYYWESASVIPASQRPTSVTTAPTESAIYTTSSDVSVYVRVDVDALSSPIPGCPTATWAAPSGGFTRLASGTATLASAPWTFTAGLADPDTGVILDELIRPATATLSRQKISFGAPPASGRRVFGYSPDNRFFAYIFGPTNGDARDWRAIVVALDNATDFGGATIPVGTSYIYPKAPTPPIRFDAPFDTASFGWIGSSALWMTGTDLSIPKQRLRYVGCFRSTNPVKTVVEPAVSATASANWAHVASPCGAQLAVVQPGAAAASVGIRWISTVDAQLVSANHSGSGTTVQTIGHGATITTHTHARLGVEVVKDPTTTPPTSEFIDDPDEIQDFSALFVQVDRIRGSTLGTSAQGVVSVGLAATPAFAAGAQRWVEVPNATDWDNQTEQHWCLCAQTYGDKLGLPRVWSDQQTHFPSDADARCAQNNVEIY